VLINGGVVVVVIYTVRILYMKFFVRQAGAAEYFLAPRGLISILLFFSIPEAQKISAIENSLLFFVILATSLIMTFGLVSARQENTPVTPAQSDPS